MGISVERDDVYVMLGEDTCITRGGYMKTLRPTNIKQGKTTNPNM